MNAVPDRHARLAARLRRVVPAAELALAAPLLERIAALKVERAAAVLAHNYQAPLVSAAADFTGDTLAMAEFARTCPARTLLVCGVRFMAETVKLLCPDKCVLLSASEAGCSLADSISAESVRTIRECCPGVPAIAYLNTSVAVKAEVDVCCSAGNALAVVRALGAARVIMLPDQHLAGFVARHSGVEVIAWGAQCEVHTRFSAQDIRSYRESSAALVLAHPQCPEALQAEADFVGSSQAMVAFLTERRPPRAMLLTECAMADTVALECLAEPIEIDPVLAGRARASLARMLEVG